MDQQAPPGNSLFDQPWWLDAAAPGGWSEVVVRDGDAVRARLPYGVRSKLGFTLVSQPPLTPVLGPSTRAAEAAPRKRRSLERRWTEELIAGLPDFDVFQQAFSPKVTDWLPFHWKGFSATVRYTHRIHDVSDPERVWQGFASATRRQIQKGGKELEVHTEPDLLALMRLVELTFRRQGLPLPHGYDVLQRVDAAAAAHDARRGFFAVGADGRVHAGLYLVWDAEAAYTLVYGRDDQLASSAAMPRLHWEAIQFAAGVTRAYDFVGSMIEPIERFIRGFGAEQVPYFYVTATSRRARALWPLRQRLGGLRPHRPRGARPSRSG